MSASSLPLYAVIELLIRVSEYNAFIGEYKDHTKHSEGYIIKTTKGTILFTTEMIDWQFKQPNLIEKQMLLELASSFKGFY